MVNDEELHVAAEIPITFCVTLKKLNDSELSDMVVGDIVGVELGLLNGCDDGVDDGLEEG